MKFVFVVVCFVGIAVVSSAPVEENEAAKDAMVPEGQERAEIPLDSPDRSAADERAADVAAPTQMDERAAESQVSVVSKQEGLAERGMFPSARDIIGALQDKYLTKDGQDLVKSFMGVG